MLIDLSGKTALVTGSTQGIGAAIATALATAGATVGINGRTPERVAAALEQIGNSLEDPSRLIPAPGDVTTEAGAHETISALPAFDILVNSLGIFGAAEPLELPDAEWLRYFETNVLTAVRLTRAAMPGMIERGWGRVINIASDSAIVIPAEMIHYGMSKTSLLAVSRGFAKASAGTGVTVNSVIAGPTHTTGVEDFVYQLIDRSMPWAEAQREFMQTHRPQSLLGRFIEPEEIAYMVTYLASPFSSATTGGALRVDGGYVDAIYP